MPRPGPIKKVLIVDDERDLVEPLVMRLAADPRFEVAAAFDGAEGLRKALIFEPDLAVIDVSMPEMDGWELCRRLRADPRTRGTTVVIMTAWVTADLRKRARLEGAAEVLLKPFEETDLLAALSGDRPV